jgi:hypothetical protein
MDIYYDTALLSHICNDKFYCSVMTIIVYLRSALSIIDLAIPTRPRPH